MNWLQLAEKIVALKVLDLQVVNELYKDLLSPSVKNLGKALATLTDAGNSLLWKVTFYNEKQRVKLADQLKQFEKGLEQIPTDKIISISDQLSNQIFDRFAFSSNDDLAEMFQNLLLKAASEDTVHLAHPGFIAIIDRLSSDEAKILQYMQSSPPVPAVTLSVGASNYMPTPVMNNETLIERHVQLLFPQNSNMYFENLVSLGILKLTYDSNRAIIWKDKFDEIWNAFQEKHDEVVAAMTANGAETFQALNGEAFYEFTDYGRMFLNACFKTKT